MTSPSNPSNDPKAAIRDLLAGVQTDFDDDDSLTDLGSSVIVAPAVLSSPQTPVVSPESPAAATKIEVSVQLPMVDSTQVGLNWSDLYALLQRVKNEKAPEALNLELQQTLVAAAETAGSRNAQIAHQPMAATQTEARPSFLRRLLKTFKSGNDAAGVKINSDKPQSFLEEFRPGQSSMLNALGVRLAGGRILSTKDAQGLFVLTQLSRVGGRISFRVPSGDASNAADVVTTEQVKGLALKIAEIAAKMMLAAKAGAASTTAGKKEFEADLNSYAALFTQMAAVRARLAAAGVDLAFCDRELDGVAMHPLSVSIKKADTEDVAASLLRVMADDYPEAPRTADKFPLHKGFVERDGEIKHIFDLGKNWRQFEFGPENPLSIVDWSKYDPPEGMRLLHPDLPIKIEMMALVSKNYENLSLDWMYVDSNSPLIINNLEKFEDAIYEYGFGAPSSCFNDCIGQVSNQYFSIVDDDIRNPGETFTKLKCTAFINPKQNNFENDFEKISTAKEAHAQVKEEIKQESIKAMKEKMRSERNF